MFFSDRGRTRRTAAFDEQHAIALFHAALPPPDLNDQEHRKDYLSSETDRPRERAVGGKLITSNPPNTTGVSIREVHGGWMQPMNTSPASVASGVSIGFSAFRISFARTISD